MPLPGSQKGKNTGSVFFYVKMDALHLEVSKLFLSSETLRKHPTEFHLKQFKNVEADEATQCFWWISAVQHRMLNSMLFLSLQTCEKA